MPNSRLKSNTSIIPVSILTHLSCRNLMRKETGQRPWTLLPKVHIALPGATQNEVSGEEAEALVKAGVRVVAEGSNMGCTAEAIEVFEASRRQGAGGVWYAPGKASNCGGVAVSGLEMAQNSQRLTWTPAEVDAKLKGIMGSCFEVRFLFLSFVWFS